MRPLSPLQKNLVRMALFTNREIASMWGISPRTVAGHFTAVYEKIGAGKGQHRKRKRLIILAVLRGVVGPEEFVWPQGWPPEAPDG